jgi:DNA polymerase-3 subunit epsilon
MVSQLKLERPIVFFDLETTGLKTEKDRIIEIAVVRVSPFEKQISYNRRLNPGIPIPAEATAIHGITDGDVADKPSFGDIAQNLWEFFEGCDLGGFNIKKYDLKVLCAEFKRAGIDFKLENRSIIDPIQIFYQYEPRDLAAAVKFYLGENHENQHAAKSDVEATVKVLDAMLDRYKDLPHDVNNLHKQFVDPNAVDLDKKFIRKDGIICFNFGKYIGQAADFVRRSDPGYLKWILSGDFMSDTKKVVEELLNKKA